MKLGRYRALYLEGAQGPPLLRGEHHLLAEPLRVPPWFGAMGRLARTKMHESFGEEMCPRLFSRKLHKTNSHASTLP